MSGPRPAPADLKHLDFERKPMIGWFNPAQLARTGIHAALSSVFGAYADKRELQAALDATTSRTIPEYDYHDGVFWMDYVADLGDGFDPTYTVALALAQSALQVPYTEAEQKKIADTRRGSILLMGGDQVYPSATRQEYRDRLYGPYEAAFPWKESGNPHLYAIPGNHDWYDGLTSFIRLFCQGRYIGGWKTQQTRSYFAAKLPGPWWLWGLDLQLSADLDDPQRKYFQEVATKVAPGDRFIICTPAPSWVKCGMGEPRAFEVLDFFLKNIIPQDADVSVLLSGDLHHYARYESKTGQQRITSGGGGAYLFPTHNLPEVIEIERSHKGGTWTEELTREAVYPPAGKSRSLGLLAIAFLRRNRQFAALLGAIYLLFSWMLESASGFTLLGLLAQMRPADWATAMAQLVIEILKSPAVSVLSALVVLGLGVFATAEVTGRMRQVVAFLVGTVHGMAQLALGGTLMWLAARYVGVPSPSAFGTLLGFAAVMLLGGSIAGGVLMGIYLFLSNLTLKLHDNETFSSQGIPHYKNFLRFKFESNGSLTIYPVAIDKVTTSWKANPGAAVGDPWIVPSSDKLADCHLAEPPVVMAGRDTSRMEMRSESTVSRRP